MTVQNISDYASPPFKFIINGRSIYIHASLISQHSKPLERMINGEMAESQQGFAILKEVDEGTFGRFVQWAYHDYYPAAEHTSHSPSDGKKQEHKKSGVKKDVDHRMKRLMYREPSPESLADAQDDVDDDSLDDGWGTFAPRKVKKMKQKRDSTLPPPVHNSTSSQALKESFLERKTSVRQTSINIPPPRPNQACDEDYTEVFLSHARLYVFAEQYDIQPLKSLALEELQTLLAIYTLYEQRTGDIISLLQYIYANTSEPRDGIEDLRTLMTHYVGYEMGTLMKDEGFVDLMIKDGGEMMRDFMKMVAKRI